jgi:solute carrier family 25 phosphate transporter 3
LRNLVNEEGLEVLAVGLSSTVAGYAVHGSLKFGFYEFFKTQLTDETQAPLVLLMSGALAAEFIASVFLTPFEAARIRLVSDPEFADGLVDCWLRISAQEGPARLFYGFPAILAKHGPGTVLQLTTFEALSSALSETMESRTAIVLIAGLCSAVLATLASQPGDCLLTAINAKSIASLAPPTAAATSTTTITTVGKDDTSVSVIDLMRDTIRELGLRGLFRGTKERLLHVAVIVVIQLSIYDSIKASLGIAVGH